MRINKKKRNSVENRVHFVLLILLNSQISCIILFERSFCLVKIPFGVRKKNFVYVYKSHTYLLECETPAQVLTFFFFMFTQFFFVVHSNDCKHFDFEFPLDAFHFITVYFRTTSFSVSVIIAFYGF